MMHDSDKILDKDTLAEIQTLEESLWRAETRYNYKFMDRMFSPDFFEFGRSGKTYSRTEMILNEGKTGEIAATIPLPKFHARYLTDDVVQTIYVSEVKYDGKLLRANRSSIWSRLDGLWQLRFHQGTPIEN